MKALFIIAQEGFRDEEYYVPKKILEDSGVEVDTASPRGGVCSGMLGGKVKADVGFGEVNPEVYDAVVVVGGSGSPRHLWGDVHLHRILQSAHNAGKVVAGICLSGVVLAKAGLLKGRKATVFDAPEAVIALRDGGAVYIRSGVVADGNTVTAAGPAYAQEFGKTILEAVLRR